MADTRVNHEQSSQDLLISKLKNKDSYINELEKAIGSHDDLLIYQLLNPVRYQKEINNDFTLDYGDNPFDLVKDQRADFAHFLSDNLIDYLISKFPFFYYREVEKGMFTVFFGNWWDRREVGSLDALNVEYELDDDKLSKLEEALKVDEPGKTLNSDRINELSAENVELQKLTVDDKSREEKKNELLKKQEELSEKGGIFESNKIKEERQSIKEELEKLEEATEKSSKAPEKIHKNQKEILALSKEDTTLGLEIQALKKSFTSYDEFIEATKTLYQDYINSMLSEG